MKRALHLVLFLSLALSACTSARLSHDQARRKIQEIGRSNVVPDAIEILRITSQTDTQAIAEASVTLAFQFRRDKPDSEWRIEAVRLGDRDWIGLDELLAAVNEGRRRATAEALHKIADAIAKYRDRNGSVPAAGDIISLTDVLHPLYMNELVRQDAWGNPIDYELTGSSNFRFLSRGPDGRPGTRHHKVHHSNRPPAP